MNKLVITSIALTLTTTAFAAGGHGSVTDLIFPAINAVLFFGFLIFKLKKPVAQMFEDSAKKIQDFNDLAEKKSKEAKIKLDMYQSKLTGLDKDVAKIKEDSLADANKLKQSINNETSEKLARMKRDANNKLESEKNQIVKKIYSELVDKVIISAKEEINKDGDKKSKATAKLLSTLS